MKIKYLGTAAAEAIPAMFCVCEKCREARKRGGKNIRTRSQALIDGALLIDFPADTFMHCVQNDIDLSEISDCLVTHTHADHFYGGDLCSAMPGFSVLADKKPILTFHGSRGAMLEVNSVVNKLDPSANKYIAVDILWGLYEPHAVGEFTVTTMQAIHDPAAHPVIYIIENKEGKRLLYAHDTGYFCDEVWDYIKKSGVKFDFVSLDCTNANDPQMPHCAHMNLTDNIRVMNRLKELGAADGKTIFCANHFSHNGTDVLYEEFSEIAEKAGIITSYDGMEVEF